ncbi:NADH-quinone oxidoreductase subunit NuoE [Clostridium aestuarii]|uniref:NADH-quinone oxidoreductase subunit NuoE n=1 Tax=Clostridium aestuarii TaxID=338193 RepID=A0ABT4CX34_9CLOT|nr:NADH-quinone oxidoreductase subunit NuoE [Clostridium aestuarii]MCY6483402.1 NADH-quinone oxidoreductase subunit NuoE [Clostridium aestuarii]
MKENKCCCGCGKNDDRLEKTREIIEKHKNIKGALIPILHDIQKIYGYLPEEALKIVCMGLKIPMSEIYGVVTFYSEFALEPKGKHTIKVCMGTACYVKGAQAIIEKLSSVLDVKVGKTTKNGEFTLEAARCLGSCGLAPVVTVDDKVYGGVHPNDVIRILEEYK